MIKFIDSCSDRRALVIVCTLCFKVVTSELADFEYQKFGYVCIEISKLSLLSSKASIIEDWKSYYDTWTNSLVSISYFNEISLNFSYEIYKIINFISVKVNPSKLG